VAFTRVIRAISGETADALIGRDLVQKIWQLRCIPDVTAGDFNRSNFQRFLVDAYVYPTPDAAFGAAMLASVPLLFTFSLDPHSIDENSVAR